MKYILAIDQGTTGSRAVVYDKNGRIVTSAYREFRQYFPRPGWVEHDPEEIWTSVRDSIQEVMRRVAGRSIVAIGITNQRETTVLWDRETGTPVHRAIVWQCRRTAPRCAQLKKQQALRAMVRTHTGLPLDAYFSATKIEWIIKNSALAAQKARQGRLCFGTTDSWVLWKLTGGRAHATDYTNASRTMLFDIRRLRWDGDILKVFGVAKDMLPEVRNSSGNFGQTARIGRLPQGIPICGIAGDQQAALFGQACFEPGQIKNTYGTGAFLLLNIGATMALSRHGLITTLGCGVRAEPVYVLEGSVFIAGAALQWLRDKLGLLRRSSDSEAMALAVSDTGGVYFVPALVGLGAPYWDPDARGLICGITRGTMPEHIVRSALEAMCYQTQDVLAAMQQDAGLAIRDLKVDGGAAANDFLCQFQADISGISVTRPRHVEITSRGAAYLAGLAVGYWKDTAQIRRCAAADRKFEPRMPRPRARALYDGWKKALARTRS